MEQALFYFGIALFGMAAGAIIASVKHLRYLKGKADDGCSFYLLGKFYRIVEEGEHERLRAIDREWRRKCSTSSR